MVAMSLYRGNLHRAPDVPRRWLMPTPTISLKHFKCLLHRRSLALSRLRSSAVIATTSNPNPPPDTTTKDDIKVKEESVSADDVKVTDESVSADAVELQLESGAKRDDEKGEVMNVDDRRGKENELDGGDETLRDVKSEPGAGVSFQPDAEAAGKTNVVSEKEQRKKEVEEKLQVLKGKKHNLVQVLKQILNVEEELKRRNTTQGLSIRPSVPLQVDVTNDSTGLITRHAMPRAGMDGNVGGEVEGAEAGDASNQNIHSRHLHRMSSLSPSSESPLRRASFLQHNLVPHPSPSRFAPTAHQGHPANLPTVSISGTNYAVSSPSPAASGGTSAFKEGRQLSPWN